MQLISLFQYLLTVAETHDSSQQPTDFNILPPFIAMWKLYGVVLNEAGAMIGRRPLPKLPLNPLPFFIFPIIRQLVNDFDNPVFEFHQFHRHQCEPSGIRPVR